MSDILTNRNKQLLVITLIVITALLFLKFSSPVAEDSATPVEPRIPIVSLHTFGVDTLHPGNHISITGEVESRQKANIKAQLSETIDRVLVTIGQAVFPGQQLLTLSNDSLVAQKNQLLASLEAEEVRLLELKKGTRIEQLAIYETQLKSAQVAYSNAQATFFDKIHEGYTRADDAIHNNLDTFFTNPRDPFTELVFLPYDLQIKIDLEKNRPLIEDMLQDWKVIVTDMNKSSDLSTLSNEAQENLLFLRDFTNTLASGVNALTPSNNFPDSTLAQWRGTVSGVRTGINGAISALIASGDGYLQTAASLAVAESQLNLARAGATAEQIKVQEARVDSARASLTSLQSTLSKTYIQSPISGIVAEVPNNTGDLVNPGQLLVTVINTDALSVTTFISTDDLKFISLESPVVIEEYILGKVTQISPSVNSQTKKVEVIIAVDHTPPNTLVDGQFVNLHIQTKNRPQNLPLAAIKTEGDNAWVYTLTPENIVEAHGVQLGKVLGENIEIVSGLENIQQIVSSVRGIEEGSKVLVK